MILDLDRFKEINDALGHHMGDQVLQQVSARLKAQMSIGDTIGQVKPCYQIGIPLMQVDCTGVYLKESNTAFHGFHQRAGGAN